MATKTTTAATELASVVGTLLTDIQGDSFDRLRLAAVAIDASAVAAIEDVMMVLGNRKVEVTEHLFGGATSDYLNEWYGRDPFAYWCHLDTGNRAKLYRFARDFYSDDRRKERKAQERKAS